MKAFHSVTSHAVVLDRPDVDTDQIIPKQFLKRVERARAGEEITVDLESRTAGGYPFELDDHARESLLEGLDDVALTLREDEKISAYEAAHPALISTLTV